LTLGTLFWDALLALLSKELSLGALADLFASLCLLAPLGALGAYFDASFGSAQESRVLWALWSGALLQFLGELLGLAALSSNALLALLAPLLTLGALFWDALLALLSKELSFGAFGSLFANFTGLCLFAPLGAFLATLDASFGSGEPDA